MFSKILSNFTGITLTIVGLVLLANNAQANVLLDPTRPPGISFQQKSIVTRTQSQWRLSSTLIANSRRSARINGKLVRTGDSVNGAKIVEIQAWAVTLKRNNKLFKVYMFNKKVNKKVIK